MASNSGWSKGLPSGSSSIALGDNDIRSNNSVLQAAWEDEHYFTDGSAASAGVHKLGSARVYSITSYSQLSNPTGDGDGRIAWNGGDNSLWVADGSNSTWTKVTSDLNTSSVNTWEAKQVFTGGIESSSTVTITQDLIASGGGSLTGTWSDLGTVTTMDLNGGTVDGVTIGGSSAGAVNATTLNASSTLSVDGATKLSNTSVSNLSIMGNLEVIGTVHDLGTVTTADINGGTIDGSTIGGSSAAAGNFTTLDASSTLSVDGVSKLSAVSSSNVSVIGDLSVSGDITADNATFAGTISEVSTNTLKVGAQGAEVSGILSTTVVWDIPSTGNDSTQTTFVALTGATPGDTVLVSQSQITAGALLYQAHVWGWVPSANSVELVYRTGIGGTTNPGSNTFRVILFKF